jgi:hypothetical protein
LQTSTKTFLEVFCWPKKAWKTKMQVYKHRSTLRWKRLSVLILPRQKTLLCTKLRV